MLSEVKEKLDGPKYNIDSGGRGWGRQEKGIGMSTMQKGAISRKCLDTFLPHCSFILCIGLFRKSTLNLHVDSVGSVI